MHARGMQTFALIGAISIAAQAPFNLSATLATVSAIAEQHLTVSAARWWENNGHIGQVPQEIAALRELAMEVGAASPVRWASTQVTARR